VASPLSTGADVSGMLLELRAVCYSQQHTIRLFTCSRALIMRDEARLAQLICPVSGGCSSRGRARGRARSKIDLHASVRRMCRGSARGRVGPRLDKRVRGRVCARPAGHLERFVLLNSITYSWSSRRTRRIMKQKMNQARVCRNKCRKLHCTRAHRALVCACALIHTR
jgi:hypothetical protein